MWVAASLAMSAIIIVAPPAPGSPAAAGSSPDPGSPGVSATQTQPGARGPVPVGECSTEASAGPELAAALETAEPGATLCASGELSDDRLEITKGGRPGRPLVITGGGRTLVKGITIEADHVVVDGFRVVDAGAPGIEITASDVTVQNNRVTRPRGGDGDGVRFFGDDLRILHNTIGPTGGCGGCHADCMQTFTSGRPSSQNVMISANSCEGIDNICLMAEGPGDVGDGGGGDGTSANWTLTDNYCEFGAAQGYMIEAVHDVTIAHNEFVGEADKAIGLDIGATGAAVRANELGAGVKAAVGMDSSSRQGYQGPEPVGGP